MLGKNSLTPIGGPRYIGALSEWNVEVDKAACQVTLVALWCAGKPAALRAWSPPQTQWFMFY